METLKRSRDFKKVFSGGSREKLNTITAYRLPNQTKSARIGISVSRKTGNSVTRNLIKRRLREALRRNAALMPAGEDIVFVAGRRSAEAGFDGIERDVRRFLERARGSEED